MPPRKRLSKHNTPAIRNSAPAIVEAATYLDTLLASGNYLTVTIRVGAIEVSGETFCDVVAKVKARRAMK